MSKDQLIKDFPKAHSFEQMAQMLKAAHLMEPKFLNSLYRTYHIRYNRQNHRFQSDFDHPNIFYDATYQDVRECVVQLLLK